ncbi:MAG: aminotransferase class I/II-fold pyridoxal phosphate-dependent enzyme [Acidobacteria bacterium]|nr:aminotransferase class I/II-fold pyridoxal phosphate-dependent enzyme [Acidobacteriota bacterium]
MKLDTLAVHAGDRKKAGNWVPVTTPIYSASSYFYPEMDTLDRVFGGEIPGQNYSRYNNPTTNALEEQVAALEKGEWAIACASGMAALHLALAGALADRRRSVVAGPVLYGATIRLLTEILEPSGVAVHFADPNDPAAFEAAVQEHKPGCVLVETITNPMLRVAPLDTVIEVARRHGALVAVDSTFATPLLVRPLELGADMVVHSLTKYLGGHGDVLGGILVTREEFRQTLQSISRTIGGVLGPFEAYLAMRGVKTFALRMARQCSNACRVAAWLAAHPRIDRVHFPGDPRHPDAAIARRLFPQGLYGAMVSFEVKGAGKEQVFRLVDSLKMIVPATSLGDVHSMVLYPPMSSHRDLAPKHRQRMGIGDNFLRLSVGIEAPEDIIEDLDQALEKSGS